MGKSYEEKFADFAVETEYSDIPVEVRRHAKLILADTLAVIIRGYRTPYVRRLARRMSQKDGESSLVSTSLRSSAPHAAFMNSSAGTVLELDEGSRVSGSHMSVQGFPAALAVGQQHDIGGEELARSFLIGYEVGSRVGGAVKPLRAGLHTHGTWAAVGAAVAATLAAPGARRPHIVNSMRIAANMSHSTSWNSAFEGALLRNFYAGFASMSGVLSSIMARGGITGPRDALAVSLAPSVSSTSHLNGDPTSGLGTEYLLQKNYFKLHACCGYAHAVVEAIGRMGLPAPSKVEKVSVRTFTEASALANASPENALAAKFSIPYLVSNLLLGRPPHVETFDEEWIRSGRWRNLARRVEVLPSRRFDRRLPTEWGASVEISLKDGRVQRAECTNPRGDWRDPLSSAELKEKFRGLLEGVFDAESVNGLWSKLGELEKVSSVNDLLARMETSVADSYYRAPTEE